MLRLGTPRNVDAALATPLPLDDHIDDVHVWRVPLRRGEARRQRLWRRLSAAERARAERFHFDRHRERFIVAHGVLRTVLSGYLERAPETLRFGSGEDGKPFLQREPGEVDLRFNLSHSADLALLAVAFGREVGVDVEQHDPKVGTRKLARRFFAPEECDALDQVPEEHRLAEFFRVWTMKEAYLKAVGTGLGRSLSSFAVSPNGEPPRLLRSDAGDADRWCFIRLETGPENGQAFSGALVASRA